METRFTQYIPVISSGEYPPEEFWTEYRCAVKRGLRKKNQPAPEHLGIPFLNWEEEGAIEDIVFECYNFLIARIRRLMERRDSEPDLDGMFHRNIDNCIYELQRKFDPVGNAVFQNVKGGVESLLNGGLMESSPLSKARIESETRLCFEGGNLKKPSDPDTVSRAVSESRVWEDQLEEFTKISPSATELAVNGLKQLENSGITAFVFRDLLNALKPAARNLARQKGLSPHFERTGKENTNLSVSYQDNDQDNDSKLKEILENARTVDPDISYDVRELFKQTIQNARERINESRFHFDKKRNLLRVVTELETISESNEDIPPGAELARRLDFPPQTMSDYWGFIFPERRK